MNRDRLIGWALLLGAVLLLALGLFSLRQPVT